MLLDQPLIRDGAKGAIESCDLALTPPAISNSMEEGRI
jgi:hypothetical protein